MYSNICAGRLPINQAGSRINGHVPGRLDKAETQDVSHVGILGEQLDLQIRARFNPPVSGRKETGRRVARRTRHHAQDVAFTIGGTLTVRYLHRDTV